MSDWTPPPPDEMEWLHPPLTSSDMWLLFWFCVAVVVIPFSFFEAMR